MNPQEFTLDSLGWNDQWAALAATADPRTQPGRVTRAGRLLVVATRDGDCLVTCPEELPERPVTGDWVMVEVFDGRNVEEHRGRVRSLLSRRNAIERRAVDAERPQALAANVDAIWLVCGLDRSQGIRSLARYQALSRLEHVTVTVVLNKTDACTELDDKLADACARAPGLEIVPVSARNDEGTAQLEERLRPSQTLVLLGPSGAGKSTLVNRFVEGPSQRTGDVRESDRRGRHTTSAGELLRTRAGALIIDTPGLRELGLWQTAGLDNTFADLAEFGKDCRFRDCSHLHEPDCAVQRAIEEGELSQERYLEHLELAREQATRARLVKGRKRRYG